MQNLLRYCYAGLFLAVMGFQITGTTMHLYGEETCISGSSHHEESSYSSQKDHCNICQNLCLLHSAFEIPSKYQIPSIHFRSIDTEHSICFGVLADRTLSHHLRGPPQTSLV